MFGSVLDLVTGVLLDVAAGVRRASGPGAVVCELIGFVCAQSGHAGVRLDVLGAAVCLLRVGLLPDVLWVCRFAACVDCYAVGAGLGSVDEMNVGVAHLAEGFGASASAV